VVEVGSETSAYLFKPGFPRSIYVTANAFDSSGNESPFVGERWDVMMEVYLPLVLNNTQ
jgi:hypothetical protein